MHSFNDWLAHWQSFFAAVAAVASTLAGLLFVSLSLNREKISRQADRGLLRLARRSFADFLFTLVIALVVLVPDQGTGGLAGALLLLGVARAVWLTRQIRELRRTTGKMRPFQVLLEYAFPLFSCVGLLATGTALYRQHWGALYWLVPVVAVLLVTASWNAWSLLLLEKQLAE